MHAICNSFRRQESDEIATIANAQQAKRMIQLTQPLSISADLRKIHTHTHTETGTIAQHTHEKKMKTERTEKIKIKAAEKHKLENAKRQHRKRTSAGVETQAHKGILLFFEGFEEADEAYP
jgi:hypothetical protein